MAARYLIIGASGFLGERLHAVLGRDKAIGTYRNTPVFGGIRFDASTMRLADTVLKEHPGLSHAFIVHGITGIDDCARHPEATARVNVAATQRVIDDLVGQGIVPVFASSDAVFDGSRGLWSEEDPVGPIGTYGRQKVEVERYLLEQAASALVLRLAKVVSATAGANDLLEDWLNQLETREATIRCATDQMLSPVTVADAAEAFVRLADDGKTGIFHVCGPRPVSRLRLLEMLRQEASRYGDLPAQIIPCSLHDLKVYEVRPLDNSMSPSKLYSALGRSFDDPRETCRKAVASRYAGRAPAQTTHRSNAH